MAFKFTEEQLNTLDKSFIVNLFLQLQDQKEASGERYELYLYTPLRRRDTVLRMDQ